MLGERPAMRMLMPWLESMLYLCGLEYLFLILSCICTPAASECDILLKSIETPQFLIGEARNIMLEDGEDHRYGFDIIINNGLLWAEHLLLDESASAKVLRSLVERTSSRDDLM